MQIIPAIDIRDGQCVRLSQGDYGKTDHYGSSPEEFAIRWQELGADRLHVVDLDGARLGDSQPSTLKAIRDIAAAVSLPIQVGGGVRDMARAQRLLDLGVERVILGTTLVRDPEQAEAMLSSLGDRAIVGIDARDGEVAVSGWLERTALPALEFARRMEEAGARRIIFTDISRDGMLKGVNLEALAAVADCVKLPVIASGGVTSADDIRGIASLGRSNIEGAIIGKALYTGALDLATAIAASRSAT